MNEEPKMNLMVVIFSAIGLSILYSLASIGMEAVNPLWFDIFLDEHFYAKHSGYYYSDWEAVVIFMFISGILFTVPVMLLFALWGKALWNNVVPVIFGTRKITYWEAFALETLVFFYAGVTAI